MLILKFSTCSGGCVLMSHDLTIGCSIPILRDCPASYIWWSKSLISFNILGPEDKTIIFPFEVGCNLFHLTEKFRTKITLCI
jgi:hypothetical protein